jgi:hypothetical protein
MDFKREFYRNYLKNKLNELKKKAYRRNRIVEPKKYLELSYKKFIKGFK